MTQQDSTNEPETIPVIPCDGEQDAFPEEKQMSLGDHLAELRHRLIICLLTVGGTFFAFFFGYAYLWKLIWMPMARTAAVMDISLEELEGLVSIQNIAPMGGFLTIVRIAVYAAVIVTMPVLMGQAWGFIAPGLSHREKIATRMIFLAGSVLFFCGVAVAYLYGIPLAFQFLLAFNETLEGLKDQWTLDQYVSFVSMTCLGFGICFELPLVMMALAKVRIITPEAILLHWRQAILAMVVLGAVFTPPDPVTQLLLASIMVCLFFVGYLLARWVSPKS